MLIRWERRLPACTRRATARREGALISTPRLFDTKFSRLRAHAGKAACAPSKQVDFLIFGFTHLIIAINASKNMENKASIVCPFCMKPNAIGTQSCQSCGNSLSGASTLDPLGTIQAEGALWRKSMQGRPKPIVLAVVWIIFLPLFLISAAAAINIIMTEAGSGGFFFFWLMVCSAIVSFIFLFRVTRNYLTIPEKEREKPIKTRKKLTLSNRKKDGKNEE